MRLHVPFVRLALQVDATALAAEVSALPDTAWRAHPEAAPGNTAVPLVAVGGNPDDDATIGAMAPTPALLGMPYTQAVLAALGAPIGRCRLMCVAAEGQLGSHVDTNRYWQDHLRVHVPVITDPAVRFTCDGKSVNMAVGEVWVFDTWRRHGVVNPASFARVHLVIDTVASGALWQLIDAGEAHGTDGAAIGRFVEPDATPTFESMPPPAVTGPWQQRVMADGLLTDLGDAVPDGLRRTLRDFLADWQANWVQHGPSPSGRPRFAELLTALDAAAADWQQIALPNGTNLAEAVRQLLVRPGMHDDVPRAATRPTVRRNRPATALTATTGSRLDRPVFIVSPPRSGSTLLFEALSRAAGLHTIGGESHKVFERIAALHPANRDWDSNRLTAADATEPIVRELEEGFVARSRDRDDHTPRGTAPFRLLEKTPKNALRVPFLAAAFPDAVFVYLHRAPEPTISSMIEAWASGRFVTYPQLPGWAGPKWSLLLTPEWRALLGDSIPAIAARQWATTTQLLLDDLAELDPARWCAVRHEDVVADPDGVVGGLARRLDLQWDRPIIAPLPPSKTTLDAPAADKWRRHEHELADVRHLFAEAAERSASMAAHHPSGPVRAEAAPRTRPAAGAHGGGRSATVTTAASFASVHTAGVGQLLAAASSSLVVTTYQAGRVVLVRSAADGTLNTHLRAFPRPMGVAVDGSRLALGTDQSIWQFVDQPALAARLPDGPHDACYTPRAAHVTGDISVHEMAFVDDELWVVNTRFSCLATLSSGSSFVPRWRPRFVTALAAEDRCHLNGMALVDGRPRYVTALAMTDTQQGWRSEKIGGGVVIDIDDHALVAHGLTMPHSPRWYDGQLYVLNSGEGTLCTVDVDTGNVTPIVRLPGFTRGLAFLGRYALVGLSKVREHVFAGLPLAAHISERQCGVWVVDLGTGAVAGFLRFEGDVEEIFDVQVLPGLRFPDLLEPGDPLLASSFVLPDAALADLATADE